MSSADRDHARLAYDVFAAFYDDFTSDHQSERWTATLAGLAEAAGCSGRTLLDVGCGTGRSFVPLLDRGYRVAACDVSPAMADLARDKAGGRADVRVADMRELPVLGEFDLVWSLCDAVTYLDCEELSAAFAGMRRNLAPQGVILIELVTLSRFRGVCSSLHVMPGKDRVLVLEGRTADTLPAGGPLEVWIDRLARVQAGGWRRERTVHRQHHHPADRVRAAFERAGLELVTSYGTDAEGVPHRPLDEMSHVKALYLARHARERRREGR